MIRLAEGGVSYEDLCQQVSERHGWSDSTAEVKINGSTILGCLRRDGGRVEVTKQGKRFLDADGHPDVLRDHLICHILGVREVLLALDAPRTGNDLLQRLRPLKITWRKTAQPARQLIAFLRRLGVTARIHGTYRLTELGEQWRRAVLGA